MEKKALKGSGTPRCEMEGDNAAICGRVATKEARFPVDYPKDGWIRACDECIDRRKDVFTMLVREIGADNLLSDLLTFVKDYHREYEPVSDVNELTSAMVERAAALIQRSKEPTPTAPPPAAPTPVAKDPNRSERLREFFGKICNKENWKLPINAVIKAEDENIAIDAIIFMTGGGDVVVRQTAAQKKKGLVRIMAPGYYVVIGA